MYRSGLFWHLDGHLMQKLYLWDIKSTVVVSNRVKQRVLRYFYTLCNHLKELKGLMDFQGSWIKQSIKENMIHERSTKKVFSQNSRYKVQVLSTEPSILHLNVLRWAIPQWIKHFTHDLSVLRCRGVQSKMYKIALKAWRVMRMKQIEIFCIITCSFSYKKNILKLEDVEVEPLIQFPFGREVLWKSIWKIFEEWMLFRSTVKDFLIG